MRLPVRTLLSGAAVLLLAAPLAAQPRTANATATVATVSKPLRILWIGNSYTYVNDLPRTLTSLAMAAGEDRLPAITAVLKGGQFLKGHTQRTDLPAVIAEGWDYVVLQEQSMTPIQQPDSLWKYGQQLGQLAKQAGAKVLLYVTWPRRDTPNTSDAIVAAYSQLAQRLDATLVPVGPAWMAMRSAMPGAELYIDDGSHPTPIGTYIAAGVFYRTLYGKPVSGLPAVSYLVRGNRYLPDSLPMAVRPFTLPADQVAAAQKAVDQVTVKSPR
ncbi:MAG: hypothetical protein WCK74_00395 [Gemmatimonadaceae bacterium]|jgi:hypothetical protein